VLPSNWRELAAEDVAHPWLAKGGPPVVLSVARLNEEKNLETFIRAFAKLHQRQPTVRLLMLGDGPERSKLEALVVSLGLQDAVELPGWVENPFPYMRRARVLVLASRFEGFGNVLVEAMACGTAVVSTDCPVGPSEILQGGRVGNLVPVGDEESLTRAIENAIEANGVRAGTVERALEFSVERSTEQYVALFRELRAGARRSTQRSARAAEH